MVFFRNFEGIFVMPEADPPLAENPKTKSGRQATKHFQDRRSSVFPVSHQLLLFHSACHNKTMVVPNKTLLASELSVTTITPSQAGKYAYEIASIYRDMWLDIYTNDELDITRDDLATRFADFESVVKEWRENVLQDEQRQCWISTNDDGKVVGFCVAKKGSTEDELEYIYILPSAQGKKLGITFMNYALGWLGDSKSTVLYGAAYNAKAIHFYEQFGFELMNDEIQPKTLPNGKKLPSMKMKRTSK